MLSRRLPRLRCRVGAAHIPRAVTLTVSRGLQPARAAVGLTCGGSVRPAAAAAPAAACFRRTLIAGAAAARAAATTATTAAPAAAAAAGSGRVVDLSGSAWHDSVTHALTLLCVQHRSPQWLAAHADSDVRGVRARLRAYRDQLARVLFVQLTTTATALKGPDTASTLGLLPASTAADVRAHVLRVWHTVVLADAQLALQFASVAEPALVTQPQPQHALQELLPLVRGIAATVDADASHRLQAMTWLGAAHRALHALTGDVVWAERAAAADSDLIDFALAVCAAEAKAPSLSAADEAARTAQFARSLVRARRQATEWGDVDRWVKRVRTLQFASITRADIDGGINGGQQHDALERGGWEGLKALTANERAEEDEKLHAAALKALRSGPAPHTSMAPFEFTSHTGARVALPSARALQHLPPHPYGSTPPALVAVQALERRMEYAAAEARTCRARGDALTAAHFTACAVTDARHALYVRGHDDASALADAHGAAASDTTQQQRLAAARAAFSRTFELLEALPPAAADANSSGRSEPHALALLHGDNTHALVRVRVSLSQHLCAESKACLAALRPREGDADADADGAADVKAEPKVDAAAERDAFARAEQLVSEAHHHALLALRGGAHTSFYGQPTPTPLHDVVLSAYADASAWYCAVIGRRLQTPGVPAPKAPHWPWRADVRSADDLSDGDAMDGGGHPQTDDDWQQLRFRLLDDALRHYDHALTLIADPQPPDNGRYRWQSREWLLAGNDDTPPDGAADEKQRGEQQTQRPPKPVAQVTAPDTLPLVAYAAFRDPAARAVLHGRTATRVMWLSECLLHPTDAHSLMRPEHVSEWTRDTAVRVRARLYDAWADARELAHAYAATGSGGGGDAESGRETSLAAREDSVQLAVACAELAAVYSEAAAARLPADVHRAVPCASQLRVIVDTSLAHAEGLLLRLPATAQVAAQLLDGVEQFVLPRLVSAASASSGEDEAARAEAARADGCADAHRGGACRHHWWPPQRPVVRPFFVFEFFAERFCFSVCSFSPPHGGAP